MGFFNNKRSSISSNQSDTSSISGQSSRSSLSKSGSKLKRTELPFAANTASPNSRLLFSNPPPPLALPPTPATTKNATATPAENDDGLLIISNPTSVVNLAGNGSRTSLLMERFSDSSASESSDDEVIEEELASDSEDVSSEEERQSRRPTLKLDTTPPPSSPFPSKAVPTAQPMQQKKKPKSRAAILAAEAMQRPVSGMKRLGKSLDKLTEKDVRLTEADLVGDIKEIWTAMHLFMNSSMVAAEDICLSGCDHRLYYSVGFSLITVVKSLATFEPDDLEAAVQCCKDSIIITQLLRKKDGVLAAVGRMALGSATVGNVKSMNLVQRHAELVFAECTLLKAVVGIIYSGDFIAFLKEAINMRNAYAIFRTLAKFVETADLAYTAAHSRQSSTIPPSPSISSASPSTPSSATAELLEDPSIDQDFRSGVFFGNGLISMILSLLPSTLLKIMEVFGFTGDREYALATLMKGGKWTAGQKEPGMAPEKEGIRRQMCDLALLTYHLVIVSYMPIGGVDVPTAENILNYNLERYPNGVFFLYFSGRLNATQTLLQPALSAYYLAIQAQREYIQLQHICHWDMGLISLAGGDYIKAYECYNILAKESNWSKATYAYAKAVSLLESREDEELAAENLELVPTLMQRIVGKSIPLEKFVARRARKFLTQGRRLICPGIELAYVLNSLSMAPREVLFEVHLDEISDLLQELHEVKNPRDWGDGGCFWDDYCLAHLLRGIVLRFIAHPDGHTKPVPAESQIPVREADEQALISYNNVLKNGMKIRDDHHLVLFAHYELGRLYTSMNEPEKAAEQYELVLSGKCTEMNPRKGKGKVSLQNMVILRSNAGLVALRESGKIART